MDEIRKAGDYTITQSITIGSKEFVIGEDFKNKGDFVEVVRCRDCKSSSEPKTVSRLGLYCNNYDVRFCEKEQKIVSANHFCSYGERSDT